MGRWIVRIEVGADIDGVATTTGTETMTTITTGAEVKDELTIEDIMMVSRRIIEVCAYDVKIGIF